MSKYRIYELAKDYDTTSKVIIDILTRNNVSAKNHMSSIDEEAKRIIDRTFARKSNAQEQSLSARNDIVNTESKPQPTRPAAPSEQRLENRPVQQQRFQNTNPQQPNNQQRQPQHHGLPQRPPQPNPANQGLRNPQQNNQRNPQFNNQRPPQQQNQTVHQNQQRGSQSGQYRGPAQHRAEQGQPHPQNNQFPNQHRPPQGQQRPAGNQFNPGQRPTYNNQAQRPQNSQRPNQQFNQQRNAGAPQNLHTTNTSQQQNRGRQQNHHQNNQGGHNRQQNRDRNQNRPQQKPAAQPTQPAKPKVIKLGGPITVKELASKLGREVSEIIKKLMMLGVMATINQEVDVDTATILAEEFGATIEELPPEEDPTEIPDIEDEPANLVHRPPVVTIMGHVDHGKTSLLDSVRQTNVTASEAGGITQHIGAYQVNWKGKKIVFLDTPGHEAFTAMRARGAQVTDIAILVVAADDGVMPQTIEAINHAKSAKVPIIVAINKMDRPGANPDRVKQQLAEHGLIPEDWGGETIMVPVSAFQKTGLGDLLEMILLVAEMQELKANPNRSAHGTIIEAKLDKGRGPVSTVLVQKGTLCIGDTIIAGTAYGKVRAMVNDRGEKVKKAGPSTPVEVLGLNDVPQAGDILASVEEKVARSVAEKRLAKKRTDELQQSSKISLDDLFKQIQEGAIKDLNIVIKADVQGSVEALRQALLGMKNKEVRVNVVHAGVGAVNESDVMLASASNALIIAFNVRPDANTRKAAETEKIDIRPYRVIYDAINDVEAAMTGMLAPEYKEVVQGRLEVRKVISIPKGVVAGCYVLEGKITSTSSLRVIRNGVVVHEGKIDALRRFKDDVKEVATGYECGVTVEKYRDVKEADILEAFTMELVKPGA